MIDPSSLPEYQFDIYSEVLGYPGIIEKLETLTFRAISAEIAEQYVEAYIEDSKDIYDRQVYAHNFRQLP